MLKCPNADAPSYFYRFYDKWDAGLNRISGCGSCFLFPVWCCKCSILPLHLLWTDWCVKNRCPAHLLLSCVFVHLYATRYRWLVLFAHLCLLLWYSIDGLMDIFLWLFLFFHILCQLF